MNIKKQGTLPENLPVTQYEAICFNCKTKAIVDNSEILTHKEFCEEIESEYADYEDQELKKIMVNNERVSFSRKTKEFCPFCGKERLHTLRIYKPTIIERIAKYIKQ